MDKASRLPIAERPEDEQAIEQIAKEVQANGGTLNAFTTTDNTSYFENMPADKLELAIDIESDRMANLKIDDSNLKTEREVVRDLVAAGVSGYLTKDIASDQLLTAVREIARGQSYFTPAIARLLLDDTRQALSGGKQSSPPVYLTSREAEVLQLVAEGHGLCVNSMAAANTPWLGSNTRLKRPQPNSGTLTRSPGAVKST